MQGPRRGFYSLLEGVGIRKVHLQTRETGLLLPTKRVHDQIRDLKTLRAHFPLITRIII